MITGSINFESVSFGKLRFDYVFPESHNFSPNIEKGKFSIWTIRQVARVDIPHERITIEKLRAGMREGLIFELDSGIREYDATVRNLRDNYITMVDPAKTPANKLERLLAFQRAHSDMFFMKSMLEGWEYDENLQENRIPDAAAA